MFNNIKDIKGVVTCNEIQSLAKIRTDIILY